MKRTGKRLAVLMTVLFLLILGTGATIAWGSVTVPTKGTRYNYNFETNKWEKSNASFTATYSSTGKLKKTVFDYGSEVDTTTFTWKGNYLKKVTYAYSGSPVATKTITYKKGKPSKVKTLFGTTTYKWKGNKGTETDQTEGSTYKSKLTLKKGRLSKEKSDDLNYSATYTYYRKGLMKSYSYKSGNSSKYTITYDKKGFPEKETEGSWSQSYKWTKKGVTITTKDNEKVLAKTKWTFTKTKKVRKAWNCDAYGWRVSLF